MATSGLAHKEFIGHESVTKSAPCSRCQGLMVIEHGLDSLSGSGPANIPLRRCVQCGEIIDPVILQNRRMQNERALART